MNNWRRIWEGRGLDSDSAVSLETVMELDGFSATDPGDWVAGIERIRARMGAQASDSIFDVGCGAGAFLYPLRHQFHHVVGGIDYSEALVAVAQRAMPGMPFAVEEARRLDVDERYDFVVAHSTFQYFPSVAYAEDVLRRMIAKSRKAVAVLDVNDATREEDYLAVRRGSLPEGEYEQRYRGLDHLFYTRAWFDDFARGAGMVAEVFEQDIPTYVTPGLRFNAILRPIS